MNGVWLGLDKGLVGVRVEVGYGWVRFRLGYGYG